MRQELQKINKKRLKFRAKVEKFGFKPAFRGFGLKTILLVDVINVETNNIVTDHIWFTCGKSWDSLIENDIVEFEARVAKYEKGYKGYREDVYNPVSIDYKLERPTKVKKVIE